MLLGYSTGSKSDPQLAFNLFRHDFEQCSNQVQEVDESFSIEIPIDGEMVDYAVPRTDQVSQGAAEYR